MLAIKGATTDITEKHQARMGPSLLVEHADTIRGDQGVGDAGTRLPRDGAMEAFVRFVLATLPRKIACDQTVGGG